MSAYTIWLEQLVSQSSFIHVGSGEGKGCTKKEGNQLTFRLCLVMGGGRGSKKPRIKLPETLTRQTLERRCGRSRKRKLGPKRGAAMEEGAPRTMQAVWRLLWAWRYLPAITLIRCVS